LREKTLLLNFIHSVSTNNHLVW